MIFYSWLILSICLLKYEKYGLHLLKTEDGKYSSGGRIISIISGLFCIWTEQDIYLSWKPENYQKQRVQITNVDVKSKRKPLHYFIRISLWAGHKAEMGKNSISLLGPNNLTWLFNVGRKCLLTHKALFGICFLVENCYLHTASHPP